MLYIYHKYYGLEGQISIRDWKLYMISAYSLAIRFSKCIELWPLTQCV
jgi:hypothetical protein